MGLVLIALALSIDGLAAGVSLGIRGIRIPLAERLLIGLISVLFAAVSLFMGHKVAILLPEQAQRLIGGGILIGLGIMTAIRAILPAKKKMSIEQEPKIIRLLGYTILVVQNPANSDLDTSGRIDFWEAALLGISLSVDMLGAGMGVAMGGGGMLHLFAFSAGVMQVLCLSLGICSGKWLSRGIRSKSKIGVCSGALLTALGVIRIFT